MDCLSVPKKIPYTVINAKTKDSYLYVGVYESTKLVLSKVTSGEKMSLNEEAVLRETYGGNILDKIAKSTQLFLFFINQYDDIYSIKKKIVYSCCKNSSVNNLYLFSIPKFIIPFLKFNSLENIKSNKFSADKKEL